MSRRRYGIVTRLVVVTTLAGLVTGLVGVLVLRHVESRDLRNAAAARNSVRAERVATLIEGRIEALEAQLGLLAATQPVTSLSSAAETELNVAIRVSGDVDELFLFRTNGRPVAAASSTELLDIGELAPRPELATAERGARQLVADRRLPALELVVPVESPPGTMVGALVAHAPHDQLAREAELQQSDPSTRAFLLASDGTFIVHRDLRRVLDAERFGPFEDLTASRTLVLDDAEAGRLLLSAAPANAFRGWVVIEQPERAALAPVQPSVEETTVVFVAVIAAIVLGVIVVGNRLLRPIRPLAEAVDRLEQGQLSTRVDGGGVGELAVLASGFNRMASSLEERQEQLAAAERTARSSEQRLRLLIEGVEDYAIVLLDPDGNIASWNPGAERVLGASESAALGRKLSDFFDSDDPPLDPVALADRSGRGASEGWLLREDGRRFWAQLSVSELFEDGSPYGYATVVHDLTDQHAAQAALQDALDREQEAAEELRRTNEAKSEFLAIAAHELQTPLAVILGASGVLVDDTELSDEEHDELLRAVDHHARGMRRIVERLLELSRLQTGRVELRKEVVRLDRMLEDHLERAADEVIGHTVETDVEPVEVRTDPLALRHVVNNLLSNAAKFSPAGSRIRLRGHATDDGFEIAVSDEGPGLTATQLEHVFEPFRHGGQDGVSTRGTGVGLTIVRRYVELLGGTIEVDGQAGKGSTVTVRLPS
ncbi:MAG: ATP-binding protein [Nitriliruptorales bacterium]|nr:ATP-binding protein [Nitriliruptorales bacterium]